MAKITLVLAFCILAIVGSEALVPKGIPGSAMMDQAAVEALAPVIGAKGMAMLEQGIKIMSDAGKSMAEAVSDPDFNKIINDVSKVGAEFALLMQQVIEAFMGAAMG